MNATCRTLCNATTDPATDMSAAPGTFVWVGKHRLHKICIGAGSPTVVFDSGLDGNALDRIRVWSGAAEFTRACTYDRAGYGWSDAGPLPRDSTRISHDLEILLGNASVPVPYLLVGHSFGGFNVPLFSHNNPQQIAPARCWSTRLTRISSNASEDAGMRSSAQE